MKKNLLLPIISLAVALGAGSQSVQAQWGQVYFDNWMGDPVVDASRAGSPPATHFAATLYLIPSFPMQYSYPVATTTNVDFGYFDGGLVSVPGVSPYTQVSMQVRAWYPTSYASYEAATNSGDPNVRVGVSPIVQVQLGSGATAPEPYQFGNFSLQRLSIPSYGSVQVTISPAAAVTAGAQWTVDNGTWQNSGATVSSLAVGAHAIFFKTVSGWLLPETQGMSVLVSAGQTTSVTGVYPQSGLQVFISPSAAAGAQSWRVDGGSWYPAGVAIGISAGAHTVNFMPVSGWTTPADQTATCSGGAVCTVTGTYKPHSAIALDAVKSGSTNGFSMNFTGSSGAVFVVEASTNMVDWVPLKTNTLTGSAVPFSDPAWTNYPGRYYRLRSP